MIGTSAANRLSADCSRCAGLCCVVPAFTASSDFGFTKAARSPCPNLHDDFRCGIHDRLHETGFSGCATYDCLGAGQHVTRVIFSGRDWRSEPDLLPSMSDVFPIVRVLHELLVYVSMAAELEPPPDIGERVQTAYDHVDRCTELGVDDLLTLEVDQLRASVNEVLSAVSAWARADVHGPDHRGAILVGADLRREVLVGANLRGASLVGADLRSVDLHAADLTGADLRGADIRAAKLAGALFLLQPQIESARGDAATSLPILLHRPTHWDD
jgi:hypothetical protein